MLRAGRPIASRAHTPSIRFPDRHGGSGAHTNRPPQSVSPHASAAGAHPAAFEAPVKRAYRRPPISEEEMWTIQLGGAKWDPPAPPKDASSKKR